MNTPMPLGSFSLKQIERAAKGKRIGYVEITYPHTTVRYEWKARELIQFHLIVHCTLIYDKPVTISAKGKMVVRPGIQLKPIG